MKKLILFIFCVILLYGCSYTKYTLELEECNTHTKDTVITYMENIGDNRPMIQTNREALPVVYIQDRNGYVVDKKINICKLRILSQERAK